MRYLILLAFLWAIVYSANGVTLEQARLNPLQAYVLTNQQGQIMSNSGVRLGPIDFSVETPQSLASYGIPQNLISRFQPFFGKTGVQAQQALNQQPLTLSQQDFNLIQQKFISFWANQARTLPASIKQTPAARRVAKLALNRQWPDLLEALASARMAIRTTP